MINKIVSKLPINIASLLYRFFKVGFKFHNGRGTPFIEV